MSGSTIIEFIHYLLTADPLTKPFASLGKKAEARNSYGGRCCWLEVLRLSIILAAIAKQCRFRLLMCAWAGVNSLRLSKPQRKQIEVVAILLLYCFNAQRPL